MSHNTKSSIESQNIAEDGPPMSVGEHPNAITNRFYTYERVQEIVAFIQKLVPTKPELAIICGSGLGGLAELIVDKIVIPYVDIPHFPKSTVVGHRSNLVFGTFNGLYVVCMQGRLHPYEGYTTAMCAFPVRVMRMLGAHSLIVTCAAGSVNQDYNVGDIMLIKDHLNFPNLAGNNPLIGHNDERFGPRFPPVGHAYDREYLLEMKRIARKYNLQLREGVYCGLGGPCYETIAEIKMLRLLGGDAVGMSTVHEVTFAAHCGFLTLGIALITNKGLTDYDTTYEAVHEDVIRIIKSVFRKRFSNLSLAITNRLWLNADTNYECDVLLTFPARIDDHVIIWFLEKFIQLQPDIRISIKYHFTTGVYGFYLTFIYERILKGADTLQLEKPIKQEFGGGYRIFLFDELEFYEGVEDEENFFSTQERQSIVFHLLYSIRIIENEIINGIKFKIDQSLIQRGLEKKLIRQVIPLHNKEQLNRLRETWVWPKNIFKSQPIENIRQYFGVKIALYFCWLSFYTKALCLPALYGIFIWYYSGQSQELDDKLFIINSLLNIIWATGFLICWRRRQAELAYQWNTLDMEQLEETRATYKGTLRRSPVTNKYEPYYPAWKRLLFRLCVTIPMLIINLVLVSVCILIIIRFQSWIDRQLKAGRLPSLMSLTELLPKILLALVTTVFDDVYKRVCRWLTDRAIIPYIVSNTRLSVLIQLSKKEQARYAERKDLNTKLKVILDQWNNLKQTKNVDEISTNYSFNSRDSIPSFETLSLSQAEIECLQPKWPDLYEDYLELVIQFGYIIFLSTLFPLAAFFSLLSNIVEIRADAFKLCMICQRPFSQRVKDIGHWQKIMEHMVIAAIIVNCIFCSIRGVFRRMLPDLPFAAEIFLLVCIEHLVIIICKIIRSSIENIPYWVRVEKAKMEYHRREALTKLECNALHLKENHAQANAI
ncbi:unnamed protein product [Rotaria sp. Silwood2]|nr:unnamed protein product [Rotaria sp. Silwood2]